MDYHFVLPDENESVSNTNHMTKLGKTLKKYLPIFFLSSLLPVFIFTLSSSTQSLRFFTKAGSEQEFSIWIEPANVVVSPDTNVDLEIIGLFENEGLLPSVSLEVKGDGLEFVNGTHISYMKPFNGQVVLGKVTVHANNSGSYTVTIPKDSIEAVLFDKPLNIKTSDSRLFIK
jgi:hypothetical protein